MNQLYKKILENRFFPKCVKILIILLINWIFQSIFYYDKSEKILRISSEFSLFLLMAFWLNMKIDLFFSTIISLIIVHSFQWTFNGHIFALLKTFGYTTTDYSVFEKYVQELKERGVKNKSISSIFVIGSMSRAELSLTSDIDIRVVRRPGLLTSLKSFWFIFLERVNAFVSFFPLDIYLYDREENIIISNKDELVKIV
jgi:hypothetical protein